MQARLGILSRESMPCTVAYCRVQVEGLVASAVMLTGILEKSHTPALLVLSLAPLVYGYSFAAPKRCSWGAHERIAAANRGSGVSPCRTKVSLSRGTAGQFINVRIFVEFFVFDAWAERERGRLRVWRCFFSVGGVA